MNNILKKKLLNNIIYIKCFDTFGVNIYKAKFILNLNNNRINKKNINLNKINYEYANIVDKHITFNINLFKKNSIKLNKKKLKIIKNENKNIYKKNM